MSEDIDYRDMTEDRLREKLKKLEARILRITGDPLATGRGYRKWYRWASDKNAVDRVQMLMSDRSYLLQLLFEKHCTPEEVARLDTVNTLLLDLTNRTYQRTSRMVRAVLSMPECGHDDHYIVEGKLVPEFDLPGSVLRLNDDSYYGSDFIRMAAILQETEEFQPPMANPMVYPGRTEDYTPFMTDEELGCSNDLDDGTSWAEAWLYIPPLRHINICYALHALVTHMNWSIPDALRINDYKIEVTFTVQQYSDQARNRRWWWSRCSFPSFKEILLKEAESREEGLPPESFLLQRCRDYFEEWAEEAFAEVGLNDIDLYLLTVYKKAKRIGK